MTGLCENPDRSHNKCLCKSFFDEVQSMMKTLERKESDIVKLKWDNLSNMVLNGIQINSTLCHNMLTCIAGYGLKKLFNRRNSKCHKCSNKLMQGKI